MMKQTIRLNTFETNSSSMHSLVISKDPKPYTISEMQLDHYQGEKDYKLFRYENGIYERYPFQVLRTPKDKLKYWVAKYIGTENRKELIPEVKEFIHNQTNVKLNRIDLKTDDVDYPYGYASSNDTGEDVENYIKTHNISMEGFIMNPKYVIIIDGDEYQEFKKLFQSNIINSSTVEDISSGLSFWNEDINKINLKYLNPETPIFEYYPVINKFTKEIIFDCEDSIDYYTNNLEDIRLFISNLKTEWPDLIFSICILKNKEDVVMSNTDLSYITKVYFKESEYGKIIKTCVLEDAKNI